MGKSDVELSQAAWNVWCTMAGLPAGVYHRACLPSKIRPSLFSLFRRRDADRVEIESEMVLGAARDNITI
jgi:hypothetical protein